MVHKTYVLWYTVPIGPFGTGEDPEGRKGGHSTAMGRVIVAGGGAAGMMAAIAASESGHAVLLLEQNEKLGKKLYITGKGRCNLTNAADMDTVRANVITNPKFLYSAFSSFDNQDMIRILEEEGCPVKVERGNRVFPVSDHSSDVIRALKRRLERLGAEIRFHTRVTSLICGDGICTGVQVNGREVLEADAVIVATGGRSYPSTGATGDGYVFARETGHDVTALRPALVPFETEEAWVRQLQGLSLRNVEVEIRKDGRVLYREFGEMLFTHFGVSGPALLSASSVVGGQLPARLYINLKPALSEEVLAQRILRDFTEEANKQIKNVLGRLYPAKLIPVMLSVSGLEANKRVNEVTKEERERLICYTRKLPLTLTRLRGYEEAIITHGGVSVKDINARTMESKKVRRLYFAGEVLDVDALTGGYNLQIAWSTGWKAGQSIA